MEAQRLFCRKPGPGGYYCVTVRNGLLCLTLPNDNDPHQIWYKEALAQRGEVDFNLVNKTTGKVARYYGSGTDIKVGLFDYSIAMTNFLTWLESEDLGDGYKVFRRGLSMEVSNGIISDGSLLTFSNNFQLGESAHWKFVPVTAPSPKPTPAPAPAQRLFCRKPGPGGCYCVTVRDGLLCLTLPNDNDPHQIWYKEALAQRGEVDFNLVNKTTGKVARYYGSGTDIKVGLFDYSIAMTNFLTWLESEDLGDGYKVFRRGYSMEVSNGIISDGSLLTFSNNCQLGESAHWKFVPVTAPSPKPTPAPAPAQRLFCRKPGPGGCYCVTVRGGLLCLTLPNDNDPHQIWYKEALAQRGEVDFNLVNKTTGKVARYYGSGTDIKVGLFDYSIAMTNFLTWLESEDLGDGYKVFRRGLSMEVSNGIISDGSLLTFSNNCQLGESAHWKFVPVTAPSPKPTPTPVPAPAPTPVYKQPSNMIYCLAGDAQYSVAAKEGKIVLAYPNPKDPTQHWYKDDNQATKAGSFMLVNKATFQAAKQSVVDQPLQLVNRPTTPDRSLSWTESEIDIYGFRFIVSDNDSGLAMDARDRKGAHVDRYISYSKNSKADIQKWQFVPYCKSLPDNINSFR